MVRVSVGDWVVDDEGGFLWSDVPDGPKLDMLDWDSVEAVVAKTKPKPKDEDPHSFLKDL